MKKSACQIAAEAYDAASLAFDRNPTEENRKAKNAADLAYWKEQQAAQGRR